MCCWYLNELLVVFNTCLSLISLNLSIMIDSFVRHCQHQLIIVGGCPLLKLFLLFPVVHVVWKKERGCHQKNQMIQLFERKNADAHYKSGLSCSPLYMLFERKNADFLKKIRWFSCLKKRARMPNYKSCLSCSPLYKLFERKNADAIRKIRWFSCFPNKKSGWNVFARLSNHSLSFLLE